MGHTFVDIEISDLEKKHSKVVKALVDTGASLTTLPKELADELGIKAVSDVPEFLGNSDMPENRMFSVQEEVRTGAGVVKISRGRAWVKLKGKEDAFPVWISDFVDKVLLGVVVLQSLGFEIDPTTERLKHAPLLLY